MTPRVIASLAAVGTLLAGGLGLYWKGRIEGEARERPKVQAAKAQAAVAKLEAGGERDSAQRVELVVRQREAAARSTAQLTQEAKTSEDADAPLPADRAHRLRAHDDQLCRLGPDLPGCSPTADADGSGQTLRPTPAP